jgi:hypothetical protein
LRRHPNRLHTSPNRGHDPEEGTTDAQHHPARNPGGRRRHRHPAPRRGAARTAPITIVINQSPWLDSFARSVQLYERETGARVELDVNPFAGSLEKQRNSVRATRGTTDLLIMNSGWFAEMYFGGFVQPITDIDPSFQLHGDIYTLGDTIYFDAASKTMTPRGKLMSMPIAPLIPLTYYRADLYREAGISGPPRTFVDLEANARRLHRPPRMLGMVQRGARGPHSVAYDYLPYIYGFGGGFFRDHNNGDFTVTLNAPEAKAALDYYIRLAREAGHPRTAAMDQAEVIQAFATGRAAHMITVIAAGRRWMTASVPPWWTASNGRRRPPSRASRPRPASATGWPASAATCRMTGSAPARRLPQLVPAAGLAGRLRAGRRHPRQRRRLSRPDHGGPALPLDEAAGGGAAAFRQPLHLPGGVGGDLGAGTRPQPRHRRRDHHHRGAERHGRPGA